ncbi:MAG: transcriptional regulator, partial [Planctomycetota bacterium]
PFHAYLWQMAGWGILAFAVASLVASRFLPMAYCRFGCGTGRLLDYLRRNAQSGRVRRADYILLALIVVAALVRLAKE